MSLMEIQAIPGQRCPEERRQDVLPSPLLTSVQKAGWNELSAAVFPPRRSFVFNHGRILNESHLGKQPRAGRWDEGSLTPVTYVESARNDFSRQGRILSV